MTRPQPPAGAGQELARLPEWTLFGWADGQAITALVVFYGPKPGRNTSPRFSVMARTETPENRWPPFTRATEVGPWFEEYRLAGRLIELDSTVRATRREVYWVHISGGPSRDGEGWIALRSPLYASPGHQIVPQGVYMFHETISAGRRGMPLGDILRDADEFPGEGIDDLGVLLAAAAAKTQC